MICHLVYYEGLWYTYFAALDHVILQVSVHVTSEHHHKLSIMET